MNQDPIIKITEKNITFSNQVSDWKEAIRKAAQPLLVTEVIEERYVDAMINNVEKLGDYIILVPNVAMPHARPEYGTKGTGVSFLKLSKSVVFGENKEVKLIICLATKDNEEHLSLLQNISFLIDEEEKVDALINTESEAQFYNLVNRFIEEGMKEE